MQMKINYEYPMFSDYLEPKGALAINKESHACFYYVMLAMKARALVGKGIESQIIEYKVGEAAPLWLESRDEEIARSVALIYGLESPDAFLKKTWQARAWKQAVELGLDAQTVQQVLEVRPGVARIH